MNYTAIIPARYASTRFPGKPLAIINGKPMIQLVYEQVLKMFNQVYVATDDKRIKDVVQEFGGQAVMTANTHKSGTDRCAEAIVLIEKNLGPVDVVVNIQGDEPFIDPQQLAAVQRCFLDDMVQIATLVKPVVDNSEIFNPNLPKVIFDKNHYAIYFSRSPIPYVRDQNESQWHQKHQFYRHIGLYAYRSEVLKKITKLPQSPLELAESLEQNRWIENGYKIKVDLTEIESKGIDTPDDLNKYSNTK